MKQMRQIPLLLPTTTVGSFPKPPYLTRARNDFAARKISREQLTELERKATRFWVEEQEKLDIDLLVDGEQYRGDMTAYFAENVRGCQISGLVRSYGNRYYKKPIVVAKLQRPKPITVPWWRFAQNLTERPVLGMLTGPYTMMDWSFNEYYKNRRECALAWADIVAEEAFDLAKAGALYIQIDEPALSARPEEMPLAIETMKRVTRGLHAKTATHICYGDFEKIYPAVLKMPVHRIDLEMSNSGFDLLPYFRRHKFTKDIGYGVLDVHSHHIETKKEVKSRIELALKVLPAQQVWVDPDCGLKTRTVEEALAKLKVMMAAVKEMRKELT